MERLVLDNGLKSFEIADNDGNVRGVITFNPSDFGFIERSKKLQAEIMEYTESIPEKATEDIMNEMDKVIRDKIDKLFASNVSDVIFGKINCLSFVDGIPLAKKALDTIFPVIGKAINAEMKAGADSIEKYMKGIK